MIELKQDEEFAVLTIRRPSALNALSFELIEQIGDAIAQAGRTDARALIITGEGEKSFCAGADIKELQDRPLAQQRRGSQLGQQVFAQLDNLPIPSIAMVNGFAFGGGCELALACTFRLALPQAKFGLPEVKRGLAAAAGGLLRLPRRLPYHVAMEAILTGEMFSAERAQAHGLVNRLVEPGQALDAALELAQAVAANGPLALIASKRVAQESADWSQAEMFDRQAAITAPVFASQDAREGAAAFAEKRAPVWKGV